MKYDNCALPVDAIGDRLLAHLNQDSVTQSGWRLSGVPTVHHLPWSTIYFANVARNAEIRRVVVKIPKFPDQTVPETSWQSPELVTRGQYEHSSMVRVYNHFSSQANPRLCALRPEAYLSDINAVVMEHISGSTLYDSTVAPRHLISHQGRQTAADRLRATGQWLAWLHALPIDQVPAAQTRGPADAYRELLREAERLRDCGLRPDALPDWQSALTILQSAPLDRLVWSHTDFHMRNVFVLPNDRILSIDTALDKLDSPCVDLAKMIVDIRTRRVRILTQGLVPPLPVVQRLISAFLEGYGPAFNPLTLALYEGQYLLEKWTQCQVTDERAAGSGTAALTTLITRLDVNPMLSRQVSDWIKRVLTTAG